MRETLKMVFGENLGRAGLNFGEELEGFEFRAKCISGHLPVSSRFNQIFASFVFLLNSENSLPKNKKSI